MGVESDLLRMLEPAVRPVGPGPAPAPKPGNTPFEGRSFEDLLAEAHDHQPTTTNHEDEDKADAPASEPRKNPLARLAGLDAVENPSLLRVMQQTRADDQPLQRA